MRPSPEEELLASLNQKLTHLLLTNLKATKGMDTQTATYTRLVLEGVKTGILEMVKRNLYKGKGNDRYLQVVGELFQL